jgi:hypothetical protein
MSSDTTSTDLVRGTAEPTADDTATIECRACDGTFERTDPRIFGAPVTYTCPHCETPIRLWMADGELQYEL